MSTCIISKHKPNKRGYPRIWYRTNTKPEHHVLWIKKYGELPEGIEIHHICGNKCCINFKHLVTLTKKEHRIIHLKGRIGFDNTLKTHCPKGHLLEGKNKRQRFCLICRKVSQSKYVKTHKDKINRYRRLYRKRRKNGNASRGGRK